MNEQNIATNSVKAWILAARPKTLSGAAVPVMIGTAFAWKDAGCEGFQIIPAILCFLFAFIMQIDSNFINDYFDCIHGNDDSATRLGPKRACSEGWITLKAMRIGLIVTTALGCIVGLPLIIYGGIEMIFVGALCVLFAFLYTVKISYLGLGDVLVLVFFGIVPVSLTYYVILPEEIQQITGEVLIASIACGIVIDTLLLTNNYRDRYNDEKDGKMTLVVRIGERNTEKVYLAAGLTGAIIMAITVDHWASAILLLPYLLLHIKTWKELKRINHGKELNQVLGMSARNMFVFGLVTAAGIIISNII